MVCWLLILAGRGRQVLFCFAVVGTLMRSISLSGWAAACVLSGSPPIPQLLLALSFLILDLGFWGFHLVSRAVFAR